MASLLLRALRLIPICGGWCDVTDSPETTCLRQFSNEKTVPRPCLWTASCRKVFESSPCIRWSGKVGFTWAARNRGPIFLFAAGISFIAWICIILSALALSESDTLVQGFAWAKGSAEAPDKFFATVYLGMRNRVVILDPIPPFELPPDVPTIIDTNWWDDACSAYSINATCERCRDGMPTTSTMIITSILTQTIQIATDLQRSTPYGDVNCQKVMGIVTGLYGLFSGLLSLRSFADSCWNVQPDMFSIQNYPEIGDLHLDLGPGPGVILMFVATALKAVDVLLHLITPTPLARRRKPPTSLGALPEYLAHPAEELGKPTRWGYPEVIGQDFHEDLEMDLVAVPVETKSMVHP
mmetsp:Transcript_1857/g.5281  ORF Transcript_1857/g.5281 Transcript_1857/m.5281 type:complete len:353 (-) Transcript_1857:405-1463(-)